MNGADMDTQKDLFDSINTLNSENETLQRDLNQLNEIE